MRKIYLVVLMLCSCSVAHSQELLNDILDTTSSIGKGFWSNYQAYHWVRFSGYLQPQWQHAESEGAPSFNGGDFPAHVDNRFSLRRGRFRMDYLRRNEEAYPVAHLVFQWDGTERGFFARDMWGRFFENKWHMLSLTGGLFARPFGYEVNYGSGDRESPERGRASQLLMRVERDLGAMASFEPQSKESKLKWLRADVAVMNGPGINSTTADYDSRKDVIVRVAAKPQKISRWSNVKISGGLSLYQGGIENSNAIIMRNQGGTLLYDSSAGNIGKLMPRRYYGADVQLKIPNKKGMTELRAEYLRGEQTGTATSSETPVSLLNARLATRNFDAAYFYFLQNLGSTKHQVVVKYDWYDPNNDVDGGELSTAHGHTAADVKFSTIGGGYLWYATPNIRLMLYYEHPMNESTSLAGYADDLKDDVFTARLQFRF
jgi:hypothetical protein